MSKILEALTSDPVKKAAQELAVSTAKTAVLLILGLGVKAIEIKMTSSSKKQ